MTGLSCPHLSLQSCPSQWSQAHLCSEASIAPLPMWHTCDMLLAPVTSPSTPPLAGWPYHPTLLLAGPSDFFSHLSSGWLLNCSSDTPPHTHLRAFAVAIPSLKMLFPYPQAHYPLPTLITFPHVLFSTVHNTIYLVVWSLECSLCLIYCRCGDEEISNSKTPRSVDKKSLNKSLLSVVKGARREQSYSMMPHICFSWLPWKLVWQERG